MNTGFYQAMDELVTAYPGISIRARPADLRRRDEAVSFGNWVLEHAATVDVLVNNAGSFTGANVHDEPEGALEEMIETNLYSAYHPHLDPGTGDDPATAGHIFNMSSIAALKVYPGGGSTASANSCPAWFFGQPSGRNETAWYKGHHGFPRRYLYRFLAASGIRQDRLYGSG